jgi:hypothetical protein
MSVRFPRFSAHAPGGALRDHRVSGAQTTKTLAARSVIAAAASMVPPIPHPVRARGTRQVPTAAPIRVSADARPTAEPRTSLGKTLTEPRAHRSAGPMDVAAVVDPEDDDLAWLFEDPVGHAVGPTSS